MAKVKANIDDLNHEFELPKLEAKYVNFKSYRGEAMLKKPGVKIEWTPELIAEYTRCAQDPIYFIETYVKIIHVDKGLVPFKLRGYQVQLIKNLHEYRRNIVTFARQSGKSTAVVAYLLWYILFNEHKTAMVLANKGQTAREILGKAQLAYFYLPLWLQSGIEEWNKGSIVLENGSRAIAESTSSDAIRGYVVSLLIIDEAAHIQHASKFFTSVLPTITSGETTKVVQISTPYGMNHYYKTWINAQHWDKDESELPDGIKWNGYVPLLVTWKEVPGRDQKWYDETIAEMDFDYEKFEQEYNCQFLGSSGTLIAGWKLRELTSKIPLYQQDGLIKYEAQLPSNRYVITVDVSEGKGLDFSAFQVINVTNIPYQQVCTYRSNTISPHEFTQLLYQTAVTYNDALVLIEYANLGPLVSEALFEDYEYENLLCTTASKEKGREIVTGAKMANQIEKGLRMTPLVKRMGCSLLKLLIEQNKLIINDYNTIEELNGYSRINNTYRAEEGRHDDLVACLVVFAWLSSQNYFRQYTDINTLAKLRELEEKQFGESFAPFGFIDKNEIPEATKELANNDKVLHNLFKEIYKKKFNLDDDEDENPVNF